MIQFKTVNDLNVICTWEYESAEKLKDIWLSEDIDMNVPANDAEIFSVVIDGKEMSFPEEGFWFEDLLTYLGIEIWG